MKHIYMESPLGLLTLVEEEERLTQLLFGEIDFQRSPQSTALLEQCKKELEEYFQRKRKHFDIPLAPKGSAFQQQVWTALQAIPYGESISYGELAKSIGRPRAFRAVGGANHRNPIPIIIPCHRVIGADGSLTGYGGGLGKKIFLLELEQAEGSRKEKRK